ncbi:MAG TPA: glutamyl-tRNA reductase, partial [Nitrospira sp.]|nr:glutamyl-tRNA reductase [Nitrospira sp.]
GASHYLVTADDVQRAMRQRMSRPMFLIDISVPRNIDPAVRPIDDAFLFDIDDLHMRVEQNREDRLREAAKAEQMVVEEVAVLGQWLQSLEVTPTIVALRSRTEELKRREVDKILARLAHLSSEDRAAVEALASAIVNKMVHGTMVTLKAEAKSSSGAAYVDAARRFFNLEETPAVYPPGQADVSELRGENIAGNGVGRLPEASLVQHTSKEQGRRVS